MPPCRIKKASRQLLAETLLTSSDSTNYEHTKLTLIIKFLVPAEHLTFLDKCKINKLNKSLLGK